MSLIPNADFSQLSRVDYLLRHYTEHQKEAADKGQEISFVSFLYTHYVLKDDHQHSDKSSHQQLPFGSLTTCTVSYLNTPMTVLPTKIAVLNKQFTNFEGQFTTSGVVSDIFHPPAYLIV
ncbi:MAG TPA: hypothetical protein DCS93_16370 [Microscillaceae bacterium]|nr:hypothetical protein [Microscillaceae bacterium]